MERDKQHLKQLLARLDDSFTGFFEWLSGQYDRDTGGFYYARSSIEDDRFSPDIESSAQALNILLRQHLLEDMPNKMKQQMIRFFQMRQQPETGYFYDTNEKMKLDNVMVQRAIYYAANSLTRLGSSARYPLPELNYDTNNESEEVDAYVERLKAIDLRNSWRGCDRLATECSKVIQMPERTRLPFAKAAERYLASIQDEETGLWGEGSYYVRISGTFKLYGFYRKLNLPIPHTDRMYESIMHCLRNEVAEDMCYIRNPLDLLSYIDVPIPEQDWREIVEITIENIRKLKRSDGGFSREITGSPVAPNVAQVKHGEYYPVMPPPVELGQGLVEGDMNASTQATLIRQICYSISNVAERPLQEGKHFYEQVKL